MSISREQLGRRLQRARKQRGLNQQEVATHLDLPRTAITKIESGARGVSKSELVKLSHLYSLSVAELLRPVEYSEDEDVAIVLYRMSPSLEKNQRIKDRVDWCLQIFHEGHRLAEMLGYTKRADLPQYRLRDPSSPYEAVVQGSEVAEQERRRLDLGSNPINDISELINMQGIWAADLTLPVDISGIYMRPRDIQAALLVNNSHAKSRRRFSYAHEYAHALMDYEQRVEVTSSDKSGELIEKRANAFAAAFLMPKKGVDDFMYHIFKGQGVRHAFPVYDVARDDISENESRHPKGSQDVRGYHVAMVAKRFNVSYQSATYRLKSLKYISQDTVKWLTSEEQIKRGQRYMTMLNYTEDEIQQEPAEEPISNLALQVAILSIEACRQEKILKSRMYEIGHMVNLSRDQMNEMSEIVVSG